jgi:hypothetical protein
MKGSIRLLNEAASQVVLDILLTKRLIDSFRMFLKLN